MKFSKLINSKKSGLGTETDFPCLYFETTKEEFELLPEWFKKQCLMTDGLQVFQVSIKGEMMNQYVGVFLITPEFGIQPK